MTTVDLSRNLLSAGANYAAGDWAQVGAEASLDFLAVASLKRGIDIGLGVEALAQFDGSLRQFLAADVSGRAHAAARVRAQVQVPLDMFDEVGVAVRLQAVAEAAVGVQLAIGLNFRDFLTLAGDDPRLRGVPMELLKVFLDEFTVQGGVMAKASASAMAYANLAATGSFIRKPGQQPGFTVVAEAGVGLKAGAGFRVFARFGVDDPRRLVRRSVDVAVDAIVSALAARLPKDAEIAMREAIVPLKMGLRCAFELGSALAENGGAYASGDQGKLALRLVQVGMEEAQRFVLEGIVDFGVRQFQEALRDLGFSNAAWSAAAPQRSALRARLAAMPAEAFDATLANRDYWAGLVADALALATELAGPGKVPAAVAEPLAMLWSGAQLLMKSVERISRVQARASVLGASPAAASAAFAGTLPAMPPALRSHVNSALSRSMGSAVGQREAIDYLLHTSGYRLAAISPAAAGFLPLLTGKADLPLDQALEVVLNNLGSFVPDERGSLGAEATLVVMRAGLRDFLATRLEGDLRPLLAQAARDEPEFGLFLDEVLLPTLHTVVDTVFETVLDWRRADGSTQAALRELCSSLLMRLFGRSLVVCADVMLAHAQASLASELRKVAASADQPGGASRMLAQLTSLDPALVHELVTETLDVCADAFGPMAPERRARMRDLLYQIIDTVPVAAGADTLQALKRGGLVGDSEAVLALAQLLGEEIAGNVIRFVQALLTRVAAALLALLAEAIVDIQRSVERWLRDIERLAEQVLARLQALAHEIAQLEQQLDDAVDDLLEPVSDLLGGFIARAGSRSALRREVKALAAERALSALASLPGYGGLPVGVRAQARGIVRSVADAVLDGDVFDPIVDVLVAVSGGTRELLDDVRRIEPGDDLAVAISDIALDRIEDALRSALSRGPTLRVRFNAPVIGNIDLGQVRLPIADLVRVLRHAIRQLSRFDDAAAAAAGALGQLLRIEASLADAEQEQRATRVVKEQTAAHLAESGHAGLDLVLVSPAPASVRTGDVDVVLRLVCGSRAFLSEAALSQQRLFAWVNGHELDIAGARVRDLATSTARTDLSERDLAPAQGPDVGRAHPIAVLRSLSHDAGASRKAVLARAGRGEPDMAARPGLAAAGRLGGAALVGARHDRDFPPRIAPHGGGVMPSPGLPGIELTLRVPAAWLHEGINAVAAALIPGRAQRRIERSASFLHVPAAPVRKGRPVRPGHSMPATMPDAMRVMLGISLPAATATTAAALEKVRRATWVLPLAERTQLAATTRTAICERLAASERLRRTAMAEVRRGGLKPRPPAKKCTKPAKESEL